MNLGNHLRAAPYARTGADISLAASVHMHSRERAYLRLSEWSATDFWDGHPQLSGKLVTETPRMSAITTR